MYIKLLCNKSRAKTEVSLADHNPPPFCAEKGHLRNPTTKQQSFRTAKRTAHKKQKMQLEKGIFVQKKNGLSPHSQPEPASTKRESRIC